MQLGLGAAELRTVLAAIAAQAAQRSLVVGELPEMPHQTAQDLLAEAGGPSPPLPPHSQCGRLLEAWSAGTGFAGPAAMLAGLLGS